jgi:hypothetical protein
MIDYSFYLINTLTRINGKGIPLSTSHKHLGVILSQNAKWNEHLENMITNITNHLGILRKLKFSLNRSNFLSI